MARLLSLRAPIKISDPEALRGVPLYLAFTHTKTGPKILENNSRPGDPEIINILPILKDDFIDICYKMIDGTLSRVEVDNLASVLTYKVPPSYGGLDSVFPSKVKDNEIGTPVDLSTAYGLIKKYGDAIRIYPGSMELRADGCNYALKSRVVGVLGISEDIETARQISLEGLSAIRGGALWNRTDIGSREGIQKSIDNIRRLRGEV